MSTNIITDEQYNELFKLELSELSFIKNESSNLLNSINNSIKSTTNKTYTFIGFIITIIGFSYNNISVNNSYWILLLGSVSCLIICLKNINIKTVRYVGFQPVSLIRKDIHINGSDYQKEMIICAINSHQNSISKSGLLLKRLSNYFNLSFLLIIISFLFFILFDTIKSFYFISNVNSFSFDSGRGIYLFVGVFFGFFVFFFTHKKYNFF